MGLFFSVKYTNLLYKSQRKVWYPSFKFFTRDTVDITEYLDSGFWDIVWFGDNSEQGLELDRWLSILHRVGFTLCYHVIERNGVR